jgi:hypothetical protein
MVPQKNPTIRLYVDLRSNSIDALKEIPPSHIIYVILAFSRLRNEQCLDNTIRTSTAEASLEK